MKVLHSAQRVLGREVNPKVFTASEFAEKATTESFLHLCGAGAYVKGGVSYSPARAKPQLVSGLISSHGPEADFQVARK